MLVVCKLFLSLSLFKNIVLLSPLLSSSSSSFKILDLNFFHWNEKRQRRWVLYATFHQANTIICNKTEKTKQIIFVSTFVQTSYRLLHITYALFLAMNESLYCNSVLIWIVIFLFCQQVFFRFHLISVTFGMRSFFGLRNIKQLDSVVTLIWKAWNMH